MKNMTVKPIHGMGRPAADSALEPGKTPPSAQAHGSARTGQLTHELRSTAPLKQFPSQQQNGNRPLRRTLSAPPSPTGAGSHASSNAFPAWSAQRMRQAPDLDTLYGAARPPRAKAGKASGVQAAERNPQDGMVLVHPGRIVLNPVLNPELPAQLKEVGDELKAGAVFKWNIARNGQLMLAKSKQPSGEKLGLGHPTLVGGLKEPEARMGGELRFGKPGANDREPVFYINNDSGRYSEYADRNKAMLANVASRFADLGFPVETQWVDKSESALKAQADLRLKKKAAKDGAGL
jgi:hypothetical protein